MQVHVVHEGGQLFNTGPVADSAAAALGVALARAAGPRRRVSLEAFGLAGRSVPDRERPGATGAARLLRPRLGRARRLARARDRLARAGFRQGRRGSELPVGAPRRDALGGRRDYAEAGLARRFRLAPGAAIEVSGRLHRTERYYEYSYRVLSIAAVRWRTPRR